MPREEAVRELDQDIQAFDQMLDDLKEHYDHKWVVFHQGHFVDAFDSLDNAAEEAKQRFGRGPYLIRKVGAPERTLPASVFLR